MSHLQKHRLQQFYFEDYIITLKDKFKFTGKSQVTERFLALIEPRVNGNTLEIEDVVLTNKQNIKPTVTTKEVLAHVGNRPHNVYIIEYEMEKGMCEFELKFEVKNA